MKNKKILFNTKQDKRRKNGKTYYTTYLTYQSICARFTQSIRQELLLQTFRTCGSEVIFTRAYSLSGSHRPRLSQSFFARLLSSSQPLRIYYIQNSYQSQEKLSKTLLSQPNILFLILTSRKKYAIIS